LTNLKRKNQTKTKTGGENVIIANNKKPANNNSSAPKPNEETSGSKNYNYYKNETKNSFLFF
jgi:hypothetical protein